MEFYDVIMTRRTVRKFTDEEIPEETLVRIMETATQVPSWKNTRTPRFTVITDRMLIGQIAAKATFGREHNMQIISGAPCLIIQSAVKNLAGFEPDGTPSTVYGDGYTFFDAGIAAQNISLAAAAEGLGSVIMGIIDYDMIAMMTDLPENEEIITAIAVGVPESIPASPKKFAVDDITRYI